LFEQRISVDGAWWHEGCLNAMLTVSGSVGKPVF
jgi:hypothetical protein